MIVGRPSISVAGDEIVVEAAVTAEAAARSRREALDFPPTLYFGFPRAYAEFVTDRADAFAAALLPVAMWRGERLRLDGRLSCRLAGGLRDYRQIQTAWKPDWFAPVPLECDDVESVGRTAAAGAVGSAFSGGVDSCHTLWSHLPANEALEPYRITHCLMINGFDEDTDLEGTGRFRAIQRVFESMLAEFGVTLVVTRTNLRQFLAHELLRQSFGAVVAAPALALGGLFSCFYLPSSEKVTSLGMTPEGSHPMLDHLVGTETMETIHDGAHLTRVEKTVAISRWPAVFDRLRVCFRAVRIDSDTGALVNCCTCEKCVRTMVTLDLAGALRDFRCFPRPIDRSLLRGADYRWPANRVFAREIISYATSLGRRGVARDVRHALRTSSTLRTWATRLVHKGLEVERQSRLAATVFGPTKRLVRRLGWGRGWLY